MRNDFIQDMRSFKKAIATLSASIVKLEGRIKHLEDRIKEEEEWNLQLKLRKNGGISKMKELKFRAIIPERNVIIYFTVKDLIQDKFSNRVLLWKWLEEGNQPDLFIGVKDKNNREIYENDIVRLQNAEGIVEFREDYGCWNVSPLLPSNCYFVMWEEDWSEVEIIGYRHYNLLWKRWEVNYSMPKER